jgi:hypothetical protein
MFGDKKNELIQLLKKNGHFLIVQALLNDKVSELNEKDKRILSNLSFRIQGKDTIEPILVNMGIAGKSPSSGGAGWIGSSRD